MKQSWPESSTLGRVLFLLFLDEVERTSGPEPFNLIGIVGMVHCKLL